MSSRKGFKVLAVFLMVSMLFSSFHASARNVLQTAASNVVIEEQTQNTSILYEIEELRDRYSSTYRLENGNNVVYYSSDPIHYETSDGWKSIDNTLSLDDSKKNYTNQSNEFSVSLPKKLTNNSDIVLDDSKYKVSISLLNQNTSMSAKITSTDSAQTVRGADAQQDILSFANAEKKESNVVYDGLFSATAYQYSVKPDGLKEDIILKRNPEKAVSYQYKIDPDGLSLVLYDDKSVIFKDMQAGEEKYIIPAPFMFDSSDSSAVSYDIGVELYPQDDGSYLLTYTPSQDWLSDSSRVYPVTVDPTIKTYNSNAYTKDSYINSSAPSANYGMAASLKVSSTAKSLIKFVTLPSIPSDAVIVSAELNAYLNSSAGGKVGVIANTSDWTDTTVNNSFTGANNTDYLDIRECSSSLAGSTVRFDITEIVYDWYLGQKYNYGIALVNRSGGEKQFASTESTTAGQRPVVVIQYATGGSLNADGYSQDIGLAGKSVVSSFTGNTMLEVPLFSDLGMFKGSDYNMDHISLIWNYNSGQNGLPSGWAFNYSQYMYQDSNTGGYCYINGFRQSQSICYNNGGILTDDNGKSFSAITTGEQRSAICDDGFVFKYEPSGGGFLQQVNYLDKVLSINVQSSGIIQSITDNDGNVYTFSYNTNGLCAAITKVPASGAATYMVAFSYETTASGGMCFGIHYPDGKSVSYETDSIGRLVKAVNYDGSYFSYYYYNNTAKAYIVTEYKSTGSPKELICMTYDRLYSTYVKSDETGALIDSSRMTKRFDYKGNVVSVTDSDYNTIYYETNDSSGEQRTTTSRATSNRLSNSFEEPNQSDYDFYQSYGTPMSTNMHYPEGHTGRYSMRLESADDSLLYYYSTSSGAVYGGGKYTVSVWAKTDGDASIGLSAYTGGSAHWVNSQPVYTGGVWKRIELTVTMQESMSEMNVQVVFTGTGAALVDDLQLYSGDKGQPYNLIRDNGLFGTEWETKSASVSSDYVRIGGNILKYASLSASYDAPTYIKKKVYLNGKTGQEYTMSVLGDIPRVITDNYHETNKPFFGMMLEIPTSGGTSRYETLNLFDSPTSSAMYAVAGKTFVLSEDVEYVYVYLYSNGQAAGKMFCPELVTEPVISSVDLSTAKYFPEIKDQGDVGSCFAFASTYYQFTYEVAKLNNWNAKYNPEYQFSPTWANSFTQMKNGGSAVVTYALLRNMGALRESQLPYDDENQVWHQNTAAQKEALKYRLKNYTSHKFAEQTENTPIEDYNDSSLAEIKGILNDGHVLVFLTNAIRSTVKTTANGEKAFLSASTGGNHVMTIVGYDDTVWCDINGDSRKDNFELGAFKVANSWGSDYYNNNKGYIWVAYDAVNKVSNWNADKTLNRESFIANYVYYSIEVANYNPVLIGQVTFSVTPGLSLDTPHVIEINTGISPLNKYEPTKYGSTLYINENYCGNISEYTLFLDYTQFIDDKATMCDKKWYLCINGTRTVTYKLEYFDETHSYPNGKIIASKLWNINDSRKLSLTFTQNEIDS